MAVLLWQKVRWMGRAETAKSSLEADIIQATIKHNHKPHCSDKTNGLNYAKILKDSLAERIHCE